MTYIPIQAGQKDANSLLIIMTKQLRAILRCLSNMSGLNIQEEDV